MYFSSNFIAVLGICRYTMITLYYMGHKPIQVSYVVGMFRRIYLIIIFSVLSLCCYKLH